MELGIQIFSIFISIVYGIIFGILYNFSYTFLYMKSRYRVLINMLFITNIFLIYFVIMLKINNGNIKLTFIILLLLNFIMSSNFTLKIRKIVKYSKSKNTKCLNEK